MRRSEAIKLRKLIEEAVQVLPDNKALQGKFLYPKWESLFGIEVEKGFKFQYKDFLYKTVPQSHIFQEYWIPDIGTESLYERIDEVHSGEIDDPIPYNGNMALEKGKYYIQNEKLYLCNRDTINPVYNDLNDLIGLYVEILE